VKVLIGFEPQIDAMLWQLADELVRKGVEVAIGPRPEGPGGIDYTPKKHASLFANADVAVIPSQHRMQRAMMAALPYLRGIVAPAVGLDGVPLDDASGLGILVANSVVPENADSMAEATVMLMLMMLYSPGKSAEVMRGVRLRPSATERWSRMLRGLTIGLIGYGRIGQAVSRRLQGFGVRLLVAQHQSVKATNGVQVVPLDLLLAESDIVSLHLNAAPSTRHLIDAQAIACMKPGALLVNTARGSLVDEAALALALQSGHLAGAALDTFEVEPLTAASALRTLDNLILTPHLVGQTRDMFDALLPICVTNVTDLLAGRVPHNCRNPSAQALWRNRFPLAAV